MDKGHVKEKHLKVDNFLVNKYHTNYQVDNDSKKKDSFKPKLHKRFQPQIYYSSSLFSKIPKI